MAWGARIWTAHRIVRYPPGSAVEPRILGRVDVTYPGFGTIVVDGISYDHDIVIQGGRVSRRDKGPSRSLASGGHTPLSAAEAIPWSRSRLVVGSGFSGRLPILPDVHSIATERGVELVVLPTSEACALLRTLEPDKVNAILHVTC